MTAAPLYTPPDPPTVAVQGLQRALLALGHGIIHTLQLHIVPHLDALVARRDALRARADGGERQPKIAIVGGPRTGKTTAGLALADSHGLPITHSDDLKHLGWSEASDALAQIIAFSRAGVFEGVAVTRALRKLLKQSTRKPVDILVRLRTPRVALTAGQQTLTAGHDRVLDEILPELVRRGVRVLELSDVVLAPRPVALRASIAGLAPRMDARDPLLSDLFTLARDQLRFNPRPALITAGRRADELAAVTLERQVAQALGLAGRYELRQMRAAARADAKKKPIPVVASIDPFATPIGKQLEAFVDRGTIRVGKMTDDVYAAAQKIVRAGLERGERQAGIAAELVHKVSGLSEAQATIIANDAVAQFHAQQTQLRQTNLGVTHYTWRATHDPLTRPAHMALDGTKQAWDAPPVTNPKTGKRAHPGQDTHYYACRCSAIPIIDAATIRPPAGSPYATPRPPTKPVQLPLPGTPPAPIKGPLPVVAAPPPAKLPPYKPPKPPPAPVPTVIVQPPAAPPAPIPAPTPAPPIITPPPAAPAAVAPPTTPPAPRIPATPDIPDAKKKLDTLADGAARLGTVRAGDVIDATPYRKPMRDMLEQWGLVRARDGAAGSAAHVGAELEVAATYKRGDAAMAPSTGKMYAPADTVNSLTATLERIGMREWHAITRADFYDITTTVHEEIHVYGPVSLGMDPWRWYHHVEEVSTEVIARDITTKLALTDDAPDVLRKTVELPRRIGTSNVYEAGMSAYDEYIAATMTSIAEATGWDAPTVEAAIRAAARNFKRHTQTIPPDEALEAWLDGIPGLTIAQHVALGDAMTTLGPRNTPTRSQRDYLLEWFRKASKARRDANP